MLARERCLLGGVGALAPTILNLLVVDLRSTLHGTDYVVWLGYGLRVTILFAVGALVAYLHSEEHVRFKLFELGIVAPAMIMALVNGKNLDSKTAFLLPSLDHYFATVSEAIAQTPENSDDVRLYTRPEATTGEKIWQGLTGALPDERLWYVVVGSYTTLQGAKQEAARIRSLRKDIDVAIYAPWIDSKSYAVTIGSLLTRSEAEQLKAQAIREGLARDAFLLKYPDVPTAVERLTKRGISLFHKREYSEAVEVYDQALALSPNSAYIADLKGYALFKTNRFDEATKALQMAITKDPEYAWGYFDLARVLCAKGDFPRAADAIRQALVVDSQLRVAMRGDGEFTKLCKPVLATLTSG